jgi:hypothetical protein
MAGWLQIAGAVVDLWGSREGAASSRVAGARAQVAAEFNAAESERQAGLAIALSQREAIEQRRLGDIEASRALAVAAASGAGAADPTIVRILSAAKGEAAYRANVALYEGEERSRQLRIAAFSERAMGSAELQEGLDRARAYELHGTGSLIRTGSNLFLKYGGGEGMGDSALIRNRPNITPDEVLP